MGFKVKWVEDNLGVTRKALRKFEEKGLMPKNEDGQYRDYTDEDIERIWHIRVLQGIGYSLSEIVNMVEDENLNFEGSLDAKVKQLEQDRIEAERHLGYAKAIKFSGRFPSRPKEMGTVRFDDFHEKSLNEWNMNSNPLIEKYQAIADTVLTKPQEEWQDTDLGRILSLLEDLYSGEFDVDFLITIQLLPKAIVKRMSLGVAHPEVQMLVKIIYENLIDSNPEVKDMTKQQFTRFYSSSFISGDIARANERVLGKEGCIFIADAVAVFGGEMKSVLIPMSGSLSFCKNMGG